MASEPRNLDSEAEAFCATARKRYARGYAAIAAAMSVALHEAVFFSDAVVRLDATRGDLRRDWWRGKETHRLRMRARIR